MITYGNIPLPTPPAERLAAIEAAITPEEAFLWAGDAPSLPANLPQVRLCQLVWPQGAARFAHAHFLCDDAALAYLRQQAYSPGRDNYGTLPLTISDGSTLGTITTPMYLLPPRPLYQTSAPLWLLTLVDDRFFWPRRPADIAVSAGFGWLDVYASIADVLDITFAADTIPAAYLAPPVTTTSDYVDLATLLDETAEAIGQRIVRTLDGNVFAFGPTLAATRQTGQLAMPFLRKGGGTFAFQPTPVNDLPALAPRSVTVVFEQGADPPHIETVTLASLTLPEYLGVRVSAGSVTLRAAVDAFAGSDAQITAFARQLATDYYRWRLARAEVRYEGIVPWVPGGMDDTVVWSHRPGGLVTTTVRRGPWDEPPHKPCCTTAGSTSDFLVKITCVDHGTTPTSYGGIEQLDAGHLILHGLEQGPKVFGPPPGIPLYNIGGQPDDPVPTDGTVIVRARMGSDGTYATFIYHRRIFPAHITGRKGAKYTWYEAIESNHGGYQRRINGREGDFETHTAYESNGVETDALIDQIVWMDDGYDPTGCNPRVSGSGAGGDNQDYRFLATIAAASKGGGVSVGMGKDGKTPTITAPDGTQYILCICGIIPPPTISGSGGNEPAVLVPCCPGTPLPLDLYVVLVSTCAGLNGLTVHVIWIGTPTGPFTWHGEVDGVVTDESGRPGNVAVDFTCGGDGNDCTGFSLDVAFRGDGWGTGASGVSWSLPDSDCSCSPLDASYPNQLFSNSACGDSQLSAMVME